MWNIILVIVCCILLICCLHLIDQRAKFGSLDDVPGPRGLPVIGNAHQIGYNPHDFLVSLTKFTKDYGSIVKFWIGHRPFLFVSEVNMVEFILTSTKHIYKSIHYKFLTQWLGKGLLIADGQHWKDHRKIISPAFHFKLLENCVEVFHSAGDILLKKLAEHADKKVIDIYPLIARYSLDAICETAMGTSLNAQEELVHNEYVQAIKDQCVILLKRSFSAWKQFDLLFRISEDYRLQQKNVKILHKYSRTVIAKRKAELKNKQDRNMNPENDVDENGLKKRVCFLDLLLETTIDGVPLSDDDIREEVDTFMFAGHDTTASSLSFCIYELANNPDIQNKLLEEIRMVIGETRRPLSMKDLTELKYLEIVIKETLRKYPPVPFYARELQENAYYDGKVWPKGLTVEVFTFCIHRNPKIYPDPEKFDPDRFLPENVASRNTYDFVPFSAGLRNCIGQKFAMLEMKVIIAHIIHQFELSSAGAEYIPILSAEAVLKSSNGINICLKKRT